MVYAYRNKINDNKLLKQSNKIIQKQHKEIQKGMEVLEASKFRAEQSEKAKTEFLSKMSHEIRTPLNGIIGITELMQSEVQTDNIKEELKTIRISADSLLMIVNDILDYSKIEAGKVTFDRKKLDVGKVLKDTVRVLAYEADKKGIELSCEIDEGISADLSGDPFRLSQILYNLLSNAVKFTEQGSVKVKAKKLNTFNDIQSVKFEVSDTGIGISEADQETVFERFNQGNPQIFSKYGGTGLGLPITKSLIELQDGSLELKSTVGKGTTIKFILPFKIDKSLDTEPESEDKNLVKNKNLNFTNCKVLIAEDNEINLKVLASILSRYQIDVTVAKNGLEAVEKFKSQRFDTIFMDIQMPEMDGIEATKIIREIEKEKKFKPIPILALTADVMFGTEKKAKDSGMDDVVSKPFIIDTIEKVLIRYLKP